MRADLAQYKTPAAMKSLGSLFAKYEGRLRPPQASVEKECVSVIKQVAGMQLEASQVAYTVATKTIALKVPSILKSELRFHQLAILTELKHRLGAAYAPTTLL